MRGARWWTSSRYSVMSSSPSGTSAPSNSANALLEAPRERNAARAQADQDERLDALVALDDLVRQSGNGAPDVVGAEQLFLAQGRA